MQNKDGFSIGMDTESGGTARRAVIAWLNEAMRESQEAHMAGNERLAAKWRRETDNAELLLRAITHGMAGNE